MITGAAMGALGMCATEPKQAVSKSAVDAADNFSICRKECNETKLINLN
jgi:hypothetical protein